MKRFESGIDMDSCIAGGICGGVDGGIDSILNSAVLGNAAAKDLLVRSYTAGRTPHAYLFSGPEGVGKKTLAVAFAKALMGINRDDARWGGGLEHPDFGFITADGAVIRIDQVREIVKSTSMKPVLARKKVFLLDDADKMNAEASNSLLKVLEEPPHFITIILVTSLPGRLLPTIISRCARVSFGPVPLHELAGYLAVAKDLPPQQAAFIARYSMGRVGRALEIIQDEGFLERRAAFLTRFEELLCGDVVTSLRFAAEFSDKRDKFGEMLKEMVSWLRDALLMATFPQVVNSSESLITNIDRVEAIAACASKVGGDKLRNVLMGLGLLTSQYARTRGNLNFRLALEAVFLRHINSGC